MVASNVSRIVVEVVGADPTKAGLTRQDAQVAGQQTAANAEAATVSRAAVEIVGADPTKAGLTRQDVQVAGQQTAANAEAALVSRAVVEVVGGEPDMAAVTRLDTQVAGQQTEANAQAALVSRLVGEAVAAQNDPGLVVPQPLANNIHVFLHNWAQTAEMRSSYLTNVRTSPVSGAESRRSLSLKPSRSLRLEWFEGDDLTLSQIERLEVLLRHITDEIFQVPIYMDQRILDQTYSTLGTSTINVRTDDARFFTGARVVIANLDNNNQISNFDFRQISSMTDTSLTFTTGLAAGESWDIGALVFPVMDCEVILEPVIEYVTAHRARLTMTVSELPGSSALPPLKSDLPTGFETFLGYPIFDLEPDWSQGIRKGRKRDGRRVRQGRAHAVLPTSTRARTYHEYSITGKRDDVWPAVEFFDTRRGRLRAFWHIDQDQYLKIAEIDASGNFLGVSEIGTLADLTAETGNIKIGMTMKDGTTYVRNITNVQQILTVFRFTVTPALPPNLNTADVARVARARTTRFEIDELRETWTTAGYMSATIRLIETLAESDFET